MSARPPLALAVLISGRGSNMEALIRAGLDGRIHIQCVRVIADRDAPGLARAAALGVPVTRMAARDFADRSAFEAALNAEIAASGAALVALAGFMRILSAGFVARHAGALLNIHPSLLPAYKGLHTHRRALAAGERFHGASVHFVTDELDGGPVIIQARVPVRPDDTEETLSARVQAAEHRIYPQAVGLIADGRLKLAGSTIVLDGRPLTTPMID